MNETKGIVTLELALSLPLLLIPLANVYQALLVSYSLVKQSRERGNFHWCMVDNHFHAEGKGLRNEQRSAIRACEDSQGILLLDHDSW